MMLKGRCMLRLHYADMELSDSARHAAMTCEEQLVCTAHLFPSHAVAVNGQSRSAASYVYRCVGKVCGAGELVECQGSHSRRPAVHES
eukprot:3421363-Amphidinium_carterae.1